MEDKDLQKDEAEVVESKDEATKAEEEPKAEVAKVEETKEEKADAPKEEKKVYDKENLTRSIILAAVVLILQTSHWILSATPIHGNLPWFIINLACAVGLGITFALSLLHSIKVTIPAMKEDLASFIISIATMAWSAIYLLWWGIDCIRNFVNLF